MQENYAVPGKHHAVKFLLLLVIVLGMIALGIISVLRERIVNPSRYQVSFTAEGSVFAKPDIAQVTLGITTDRKTTAVAAVTENTEQMNKVILAIKAEGVEDKDIKTTSYNLNPSYDYNQETGRSEIKGYEVNQQLTVKIRNLENIGAIIEATTQVGANQVGNIAFTIDDMSEIKKAARAEAVQKAREKAEEMSQATGLKLGKLVNVYESDSPYPLVYKNFALDSATMYGLGGGAEAAPAIQTGENEVALEVTLVYEVK